MDGQSNYLGNSPPFPCFILYTVLIVYKERGKNGNRTVKRLKKMEKRKEKRTEEREVIRKPKPEAEK